MLYTNIAYEEKKHTHTCFLNRMKRAQREQFPTIPSFYMLTIKQITVLIGSWSQIAPRKANNTSFTTIS